jgi:MFS family permease
MALVGVARYSFSVFYTAILGEFGWSRADTAGAFSVNLIVYALCAPIIGRLLDRFGPRLVMPVCAIIIGLTLALNSQIHAVWQLYLFLGLMAVGHCGLWFLPHSTIIPNWFVRQRGTAMGLMSAGAGTAYALVYVIELLISNFGWRAAYVILAFGLALVLTPLTAAFQRYHPSDMGLLPDGDDRSSTGSARSRRREMLVVDHAWASKEWTLGAAVRTRRFWLAFFQILCYACYFNLILVHMVARIQDIGFSRALGTAIFSLTGIAGTGGNLMGFLSDHIGRERANTVGMAGVFIAVTIFLLLRDTSHPWLLYVFAVIVGFSAGICSPTQTAAAADLFQGRNWGAVNGLLISGFGIGGAIGPWLGGYIFDVTRSYDAALGLVLILAVVANVLLWLVAPRKVRLVAGMVPRTTDQVSA